MWRPGCALRGAVRAWDSDWRGTARRTHDHILAVGGWRLDEVGPESAVGAFLADLQRTWPCHFQELNTIPKHRYEGARPNVPQALITDARYGTLEMVKTVVTLLARRHGLEWRDLTDHWTEDGGCYTDAMLDRILAVLDSHAAYSGRVDSSTRVSG